MTAGDAFVVIPGDGVGPEVTDEALRTVEALDLGLRFEVLDHVNAETFLRTGVAMADEDVARVRKVGSVLFGAVGDPRVETPEYGAGVLLRLRRELDLYVNHRPSFLLDDRLSPLRYARHRPLDCVVVRENTEGLYAGIGGTLRGGTAEEVAVDVEMTTRRGVQRVLDYAFAIATREVCMVDKSNAVPFGGALWTRCWRETAARQHPGVATRHLYVDAAAMLLVEDPTRFDVIVTNNSYGDILSDLTAALAGGPGVAASANLNPDTGAGLFEPVHGSATALAGRDRANPVAAILSAAMLVEHLGHRAEADGVRRAVRAAIAAGRGTPDVGGDLGTRTAGRAIRAEL
jgi:3-isopropylmalate dehydrogenase